MTGPSAGDQAVMYWIIGTFTIITALIGALVRYTDNKYKALRQELREYIDTMKYDMAGRDRLAENFRDEVRAALEGIERTTREQHNRQFDLITKITEKTSLQPSRDEMLTALMVFKNDVSGLIQMIIHKQHNKGADGDD